MKTIYERMAASKLVSTLHRQDFTGAVTRHIVCFVYANGLVAEYDGDHWSVAQAEA